MVYINIVAYFIFIGVMGYYFITNMQWYSYRLERVLFHHTKTWWHFVYFLIPFVLYELLMALSDGKYGFVVVLLYLPLFIHWVRGLDKRLVVTGRVKRFFVALYLFAIFVLLAFKFTSIFIPIMLAYLASMMIEKMLFNGFKRRAEKRLESMDEMVVVGVTASYGKTSIKNFIAHILSDRYRVYATPRSVNTLGGIIKDINDDLPDDTEVYVVEMGARAEGDIAEISTLVNPHYAVVGKIGPAHIEYFRTLENIRNTKMEILQSDRLKEAWVDVSANIKPTDTIHMFGQDIKDIKSTLESTSFTLDGVRYSANILGSFNAMNIAAAIKVAKALGIGDDEIKDRLSTLEPVAHRLQRIDAGGKVILDDSFNGNIDGMMASFDLVSTYSGRKVVITPGLVEVDDELNIAIAKKINEIFDLVIATGDLNYHIFKEYIDADKLKKLPSKDMMEEMLVTETMAGDLILFANDAPSFI
ncbi:UDP-N-acetylmuramoylalanyl-D-glutamyl-2,6-diaminopimelate--D-alanyl-D-alanine ligase [hydrothermal vent metagenome]|uniref:UDP-N-acetylmuramoylalanyl-D-glutamyl-2,6-diaminopimelate--D-alanyl-D-alanine ligase n=1 Tax=hydrothermal vent metagenome TaxID=652676 RepID=A0A1W1BSE5_9ZZZZ